MNPYTEFKSHFETTWNKNSSLEDETHLAWTMAPSLCPVGTKVFILYWRILCLQWGCSAMILCYFVNWTKNDSYLYDSLMFIKLFFSTYIIILLPHSLYQVMLFSSPGSCGNSGWDRSGNAHQVFQQVRFELDPSLVLFLLHSVPCLLERSCPSMYYLLILITPCS